MKNKKMVLNSIAITLGGAANYVIAILILIITLSVTLKFTTGNSIIEVAKNLNNKSVIENIEEQNTVQNQTEIQVAEQKTSEIVSTVDNITTVSRSNEIDRTAIAAQNRANNEIAQVQEQDLKTFITKVSDKVYEIQHPVVYTKLEDVKISFNMDVSKTTGLSREDFILLVQNCKYDKTGILEKNAGWIWDCCQKYSVNEIFVLGICGIESGWCSAPQHQRTHNYASLMSGGKLIPYATDEEGFEAMIKLLGQRYLTPGASFYHGATITGVGQCYCNPTSWPKKVYTCMQQVF